MTEASEEQKKELQSLIRANLKRSDRSEIAKSFNVSRTWVNKVLSKMIMESPIMEMLVKRASDNKRKEEQMDTRIEDIINKLK